MLKMFAAAASAALLMLAPGVAGAQEVSGDDDGMLCVYDGIVDGEQGEMVAEAYLEDSASDSFEEAQDAVAKISEACAAKFDMPEDLLSGAIDLGVYGVTIDYLTDALILLGESDAAISGVYDVYDALNAVDAERLYDRAWRNDAAFTSRLNAELAKVGLSNNAASLDAAYTIMELSAETDDIMFNFMLADDEDAPETASP